MVAGDRALRPEHRLRQPAEFSAVMADSKRVRGQRFELRYRANDRSQARLGLIVPKRLARRAVLRNLLKRLARESFRAALTALPPVDVVLRLTAPLAAGTAERREQRALWREEMDGLLARLPR